MLFDPCFFHLPLQPFVVNKFLAIVMNLINNCSKSRCVNQFTSSHCRVAYTEVIASPKVFLSQKPNSERNLQKSKHCKIKKLISKTEIKKLVSKRVIPQTNLKKHNNFTTHSSNSSVELFSYSIVIPLFY